MSIRLKQLIKTEFSAPIKDLISSIKEYNYLEQLILKTERTNTLNKTIVFNTSELRRYSFDSEVFIALILARNGAKVKILLDDDVMILTDSIQKDSINLGKIKQIPLNRSYLFYHQKNLIKNFIHKLIIKKGLKTYKDKNLEYLYYSEMLNQKKLEYKNLEVLKDTAESSTIRFFKTTDLDFNDKIVDYYYKMALKNAVMSQMVGEFVLNKLKPDIYVTPHGFYSMHGPAYDVIKSKGVKCLIVGGVTIYLKECNKFCFLDIISPLRSQSQLWQEFKKKPVTSIMKEKVNEFIERRTRGATFDNKIFTLIKEGMEFSVDKNDGYKYHIALFPNVVWDANIREKHKAFSGILDWIITTVDYVKDKKNIKLYIKSHPAELHLTRSSERIETILNRRLNVKEYDNIVLTRPEFKFNTYNFLRSGIDLGLVYDGTLALEMPLLKIPVIISVNGGGGTVEGGQFIATSKKQYLDYLDNIDKLIEEFHNNYEQYYENIVRYIYWYLFDNQLVLPTLSSTIPYKYDLLKLRKKDLQLTDKLLQYFS